MQEESFSPVRLVSGQLVDRIVNVRVTHKRASLSTLERFSFSDKRSAMQEIALLHDVQECALIQTCNRVEILAVSSGDSSKVSSEIVDFWLRKTSSDPKSLEGILEESSGSEALLHLLRVSAGLESMVVGEDQILGQVKEAYEEAKEAGYLGSALDRIFQFALRIGRSVRASTQIDRGAVSMGAVGVELLEDTVGDLGGRKILIIGAGEAGEMVGESLAVRKAGLIFVANRTYQRAAEMAKTLGGKALHFSALDNYLEAVDAAVVATSAPHFILTFPQLSKIMAKRRGRELIVVDLSEPRNVESSVARIPGVVLRNIDDLRDMSRSTIEMRSREISRAEKIVDQGLVQLILILKRTRVERLISAICEKAEETRRKEVDKALSRISGLGKKDSNDESKANYILILNDLSKILISRVLSEAIMGIRQSATDDNFETIALAMRLFGIESEEINGPEKSSIRKKTPRLETL